MSRHVVITAGVRTAIGTFGGALLRQCPRRSSGRSSSARRWSRAGLPAAEVGHVVFGNVILTESKDAYLARVAAIEAGIPVEVPAMTLNRLCGSGVQAIISAAQAIMLGDCETAAAGGAETMSRAPHLLATARFGQRMGDAVVADHLTGVLTDPFGNGIMGITAENVAERHGIDREAQDAFAAESQRRAAEAIAAGRFKEQISPVEVHRAATPSASRPTSIPSLRRRRSR